MHKINVLSIGSENFNTSLEELKEHLNFKLSISNDFFEKKEVGNFDILLVHEDYFKNNSKVKNLNEINKIKILVCNSLNHNIFKFSDKLTLPTSVKVINQIVENSITKKNFNNNSSIKIKNYNLDKNEKKLTKNENFVLLTEKEIQLLELLLKTDEAISRDEILSKVWKYASQADTHTVETHIYRLRKKIKTKFADENFILNDKKGYSL
tara:strand:- start:19 stop:645 length:627 start_codon:yes stop_codon:yes gene_type:complete